MGLTEPSAEAVLRLPMRDGNPPLRWTRGNGRSVLRLPMRDGNRSSSNRSRARTMVLRLPMRDGNLVLLGTVRLGTVGS